MTSSPFFVGGRLRLDRILAATNAQLLEAWVAALGRRYRGRTIDTYREAAERFVEFLDGNGLRIQDLTPQMLCDYLMSLVSKCRNLAVLNERYICKATQFRPSAALPAECGLACSAYQQPKVESYLTTEKALARFFEFAADETDAGIQNIFPQVRTRIHETLKKRRVREREDLRYPRRALTDDEIEALFRVCGHPIDRLVLGLFFKTGLRHQEALLLPDGPNIRAEWGKERIITIESQAGIKRLGNPHLVIDDQLWSLLSDYYVYKDAVLRDAPIEDMRRTRLLVGKSGLRPMAEEGMLRLWRSAGERAGIKISPVSNAPLTPHSGRYTFCRLLEEAGFSSFWIARLRGDVQAPDANLKAAWGYAKRSAAELRGAYIARFPTLPICL